MITYLIKTVLHYLNDYIKDQNISPEEDNPFLTMLEFKNGELIKFEGYKRNQLSNKLIICKHSIMVAVIQVILKHALFPLNSLWLLLFLSFLIVDQYNQFYEYSEFSKQIKTNFQPIRSDFLCLFLIPYGLSFSLELQQFISTNLRKYQIFKQRNQLVCKVFQTWNEIKMNRPIYRKMQSKFQSLQFSFVDAEENEQSKQDNKKPESGEKKLQRSYTLKKRLSLQQEFDRLKSLQNSMDQFDEDKNKMNLEPLFTKLPRLLSLNQQSQSKQQYRRVYEYSKQVNWENIKIGDLVFIGSKGQAPCDMLIICSENDDFFVDSANSLNFHSNQHKVLEQFNQFTNLVNCLDQFFLAKKMLSGYISFNFDKQKSSIEGYFKLSKDPQRESINQKNLILREEILLSSNWVIGIAIQCGNSCFIYDKNKPNNLQFDQGQIKYQTGLSLLLIVILSLVIYSVFNYFRPKRWLACHIIQPNPFSLHFFLLSYNLLIHCQCQAFFATDLPFLFYLQKEGDFKMTFISKVRRKKIERQRWIFVQPMFFALTVIFSKEQKFKLIEFSSRIKCINYNKQAIFP